MDTYDQIYGRDNPEGDSHGWIQWKGTNVCMDVHCKCGAHSHVDAEFFYFFECQACGAKYAVGQNVKMIELMTPEQIDYANKGCGFITDSHPETE